MEVEKKKTERTALGGVVAAVNENDVSEVEGVGTVLLGHTRVFVHLFEESGSLRMLAKEGWNWSEIECSGKSDEHNNNSALLTTYWGIF